MTVRNADRLMRKLRQIPLDARSGIGTALAGSVVMLDSYAKQKIQGGGRGGRTYRRRSTTHQASAPGEFPKTDTACHLTNSAPSSARNSLMGAIWSSAPAAWRPAHGSGQRSAQTATRSPPACGPL
jgi:hypothetical protein